MKEESPKSAVLFERGSFEVGVVKEPNMQIMSLLNDMTVGSKGAQYLHKDIDKRMLQLSNKYIMYMTQGDSIMGTYTAALRTTKEDFGEVNAYYIRYFTFLDTVQAAKSNRPKAGKPQGVLKKMVKRFLSECPATFGVDHGESADAPSFYYAFFDAENYRSTDLSQLLGMKPVGEFDTFAFSRLHPKKQKSVELLDKVHYKAMKEKLAEFYAGFSVYTDQFLLLEDNYFVWRENGEVVAGVQPNKCNWELKNMSGLSGAFLLHVLPYFPLVNRYFNPKKFEFLTFDYMYVKSGHEDKLELLMESLLNKYKVTFSLIWQDLKSSLHPVVSNMDFGFLSKFSNVPTGKIMMTTNRVSPSQLEDITKKPVFTCGLDMS